MWEQRLPGYGHLNKLMPDDVFSWSSNFSLLLSTTTELLPEVRVLPAGTVSRVVLAAAGLRLQQSTAAHAACRCCPADADARRTRSCSRARRPFLHSPPTGLGAGSTSTR